MKVVDLSVRDFLKELKSESSAPGGGAVSALSSAEGVALTMMVANLTVGKDRYSSFEKVNKEVLELADEALEKLIRLADEDAKAFDLVSRAYKLPKENDEEKNLRSAEIRKAIVYATEVPLEVMEASFDALKLTASLVGRSNPNLISDLGAAAMNLESGIRCAWLNVKINLPSLKNPEKEEYVRAKGEMIYEEGLIIAEKIYAQVIESIEG